MKISFSLTPIWMLLQSETFWVAFAAIVALAGFVYTLIRHWRQTDLDKSRAKKDLTLKEIEWGEMNARHEREHREAMGRCEGEVRRHEWGSVNTLTVNDNAMLAELAEAQRRESERLMTEMTHLSEQAGEQVSFIIRLSLWEKLLSRFKRWFKKRSD